MLKEFKNFALRGNVLDLAIGVIIGGAFGKIVGSLVGDIIMPVIGLFMGGINFAEMAYGVVKYGAFIQAVIDFIVIAFVIFLIIKAANNLKKQEPAPAPAAPTTKECPHCMSAINIKATRCPNCTSQL
jgi:large conductance mechanosensitive channel